ncbi:Fe2+-dependent dioxygenase [Lysobacter sp. H23M47]|uniref:Fe2+-dependent dioxygenase n=1 Tax=Lysobacter sp. H23M47 TaxID=2781024 RepID=UPI0018822E96|nr:Fe2+-dependent dioxygenase [Lysobacter sp. H23M47]QOW25279.1 Fe2+-dependent dioxygenase [Lysobacter sp. H23M47]
MLLHVPGVLDDASLSRIRATLESAAWTDGRETVGPQGAGVKRNLQLPDGSPVRHELGQLVTAALAASPLYFAAALPLRALPPRFNCYQGGGTYGLHVDGAVMTPAAPPGQVAATMRTDISCTLFLSEPDEYDGGQLVIHDTYGTHEVKLPAGDLILYPSSSLHMVQPVTRGARLAAFFWIQSLIRNDAQRRMLFEMDTAIQALTASGENSAALLQLTGVYHNLLRLWAET